MDWNLFGSALLISTMTKGHRSCYWRLRDPKIKLVGERIQFGYGVVPIENSILSEDLIAVVVRMEANNPPKQSLIIRSI